jgi:hypothetical protein
LVSISREIFSDWKARTSKLSPPKKTDIYRVSLVRHAPSSARSVAEQEWRAQQQQHARQQDRSERVNVLRWVEACTPEPPGGVVAKKIGHETMRCLMKCYGDDHGYRPDRHEINCITSHSLDC